MLIQENCEYCQQCGSITPHSRRRFAIPILMGSALLAGGGWFLWLGSAWKIAGIWLVFMAVFLILKDREKYWHVHCERCREKKLGHLR